MTLLVPLSLSDVTNSRTLITHPLTTMCSKL